MTGYTFQPDGKRVLVNHSRLAAPIVVESWTWHAEALQQLLAGIAERDARIAGLRDVCEYAQQTVRDQITRAERADAEIAALRELLIEARDCVADCLNAESNKRHSRAERADYYAGLLGQVDAALAGNGEGGGNG